MVDPVESRPGARSRLGSVDAMPEQLRPEAALARLGGIARRDHLRALSHWRHIDAALAEGRILRVSHGWYSLPFGEDGRCEALRLTGAASHTTAANHWGWKVKTAPDRPHVTVRRKRHLARAAQVPVVVHWRDLDTGDVVDGWVTSRVRTVIDCALDLPFDEALAVADSALRSGLRRRDILVRAAWLGPRQRARVDRVMAAADARAANPFESVLRAIAVGVAGLSVEPQLRISGADFRARVDLADAELMLVLEADSHEFHSARRDFDRDCRRYDELTARGWLVLRFSWEQVMFDPEWVGSVLVRVVSLRRAQRGQPTGRTRHTSGKRAGAGVQPVG